MKTIATTALLLSLATPAFAQAAPASAPAPTPVVEAAPEPTDAELDALEARADARRGQLTLHQALGLTTLGAMTATGALGLATSNGWLNVDPLVHVGLGLATTGLYLGTAGLALTAPPPAFARKRAGSVELHRNLAWLHGAGMAATVGLGLLNFYGTPYGAVTDLHGWVAFGTYALMGTSAGVILLGN